MPGKIAFGHSFVNEKEMEELKEKYTPAIIERVGAMAKNIGGHGGMDTIMDWHLIDCLRSLAMFQKESYGVFAAQIAVIVNGQNQNVFYS